jgi:O-antigen/teichoic acid export membrane protein
MWYPIHAINLNLLQVKGRSDLFLKLEIVKKTISITLLVCSIPFGVMGMCYIGIVQSLIALVINTYYTGKLINVGFLLQMRDLMGTLSLSLFMFVVVLFSIHLYNNQIVQLVLGSILGGFVFVGGSCLLKFKEVFYVKEIL